MRGRVGIRRRSTSWKGPVVSGLEAAAEVLGLGVVPAVIVVVEVLAEEDDHLDGLGEVVGAGPAASGECVEETGGIVALPVGAHAVVGDHQQGETLDSDAVPNVDAVLVPRYGNAGDACAEGFET